MQQQTTSSQRFIIQATSPLCCIFQCRSCASVIVICDPLKENVDEGERTGTSVMTQHAMLFTCFTKLNLQICSF